MLLSIVSGTFDRKPILQRMMDSVRRQMFPGISYEFVIVDGGSTDGTLEWLRDQQDVHLIEHGELRGAIVAFCEGARAACGQYVVMANDDIYFHDNSILAAIAHLDSTPQCGAVAFADNRYNETSWQVMVHPGRDEHGEQYRSGINYAQVGMFRRWLGDEAGWWGDNDEIMQNARTYGGDNFLSSRVWEMGYTIDAIPQCKVTDAVTRDGMRKINTVSGPEDSRLFYSRFPDGGAIFGHKPPENVQPHQDCIRILYLPIYEDKHTKQMQQKKGLRVALGKAGTVLEYDYVTRHKRGINTHEELIAINRAFKPNVLFTQFHRAGRK